MNQFSLASMDAAFLILVKRFEVNADLEGTFHW